MAKTGLLSTAFLVSYMVTAPLLATGVQVDLPETKAAPLDLLGCRQVTPGVDAPGFPPVSGLDGVHLASPRRERLDVYQPHLLLHSD